MYQYCLKHTKLNLWQEETITSARNKDQTTPTSKIHTGIIILQQTLTQTHIPRNRLQAITQSQRIRNKQPVLLRHVSIATRTIHGHIKRPPIRNPRRWIIINPLQRRRISQIRVITSRDLIVRVAGIDRVLEHVAEEFTVDAIAGKRNVDSRTSKETVFVRQLLVVR